MKYILTLLLLLPSLSKAQTQVLIEDDLETRNWAIQISKEHCETEAFKKEVPTTCRPREYFLKNPAAEFYTCQGSITKPTHKDEALKIGTRIREDNYCYNKIKESDPKFQGEIEKATGQKLFIMVAKTAALVAVIAAILFALAL